MESDDCLQQVLDFIAGGLQNTQNCSSQLLLLLVLLEEIYETNGSIPLLTEKKSTVQSIIKYFFSKFIIHSGSVSGIITSVNQILQQTDVHFSCLFFIFRMNPFSVLPYKSY